MRRRLLLWIGWSALSLQAQTNWLQDTVWEDGLAEVSLYAGLERKYGILRPTEVDLITVREFMDPIKRVKVSPSPDRITLPVMKQNITRRTRTGVYEYNQAGSVFFDRRNGQLVKLTLVSAEWCGNSSVRLVQAGEQRFDLDIHNYMDDQGVMQETVRNETGWIPYDALIPWLRQNLSELEEGQSQPVIQPLLSNHPVWVETNSVIAKLEPILFNFQPENIQAVRIQITFPWGDEAFVLETASPRRLLKWEGADGSEWSLRKTMRLDYWNRNRPGDETLLN